MSGSISLGVGLISGLDYASIVEDLIAIEARPRDLLLQRMGNIDAQRTAYLEISARITSLLSSVEMLTRSATFRAVRANSSLPDVLSVSASAGAQPGSYQFIARALAATHQSVSRGYQSLDTPLSNGTLKIESARARVNRSTQLAELNGHAGVQRGKFKLTDSTGQSATISITDTLTLDEVVDKINAADVGVRAALRSTGLVLTDTAGGTETLRIDEVNGGRTAADLGFDAGTRYDSDGDGALQGRDVVFLSSYSPISALNDGLGLRYAPGGTDFTIKVAGYEQPITVDLSDTLKPDTPLARLNRGQGVRLGQIRVTSKNGEQVTVDLSDVTTVGQVQEKLQNAYDDGRLSVTLNGDRLLVVDSTRLGADDEAYDFAIVDVDGHAAHDLGLDVAASSNRISGRDILHMDTLADVLNAINYAGGNRGPDKQPLVVASLATDGRSVVLEGQTGGALTLAVPEGSSSRALEDLGLAPGVYPDIGGGALIQGSRIIGGLDTVLLKTLNGGNGLSAGTVRLSANGQAADVDLSTAATLAEVVERLQAAADAAGLDIDVGYDQHGTRLQLANRSGSGPVAVTDVSGSFAADVGLAGESGATVRSADLQRRYVSESTHLADLNAGQGVALGSFKITTASGQTGTVNLAVSRNATVQDVIDEIDRLNINVEARINDTGDGLLLVDKTTGQGTLRVEDVSGTTARDLNLLGDAENGQVDGSYEFQLDVGGIDTLDTLVTRINQETTLATAGILNDGTGFAPYRLSIAARVMGSVGDLIIDDGGADLGFATLSHAQDARVLFGGDIENGILLTSHDNTFDDVVDGLSFTVSSLSDTPVTVTVERDYSAVVDTLQKIVDDFNAAMDRIVDVGDYDPETEEAGILLGEGTLQIVENRLYRLFTQAVNGDNGIQRLSDVGIRVTGGSHLALDEQKFRAAFEAKPEAVIDFFANEDYGIGKALKKGIQGITDGEGLITRRTETLADQRELLESRVERLNDLLDSKRARLTRQFIAMEQALSAMQSQQNALASLASLASSSGLSSLSTTRT